MKYLTSINLKRENLFWGLGIFTGILLIVFFVFDPEKNLLFPPCLFHKLTGYQCPGCGIQRAVHHLLHFRLGQACHYNVLAVAALPLIALLIYLENLGGKRRFTKLHQRLTSSRFSIVVLGLILVYWVLRNMYLPL